MPVNIIESEWKSEINDITDENMRIGFDFMIIKSFSIPEKMKEAFKVDNMTFIVFCEQGECHFTINMSEYRMKAPYMATFVCGKIIEHKYISDDFKASIIVASNKFFSDLFSNTAEAQALSISINKSPAIQLDGLTKNVTDYYFILLQQALNDIGNKLRPQVVKHLTLAMYYGYGRRFLFSPYEQKDANKNSLLHEFIELVEQYHKKERNLFFYADKLCLTPKYLSAAINKASGRTAVGWIDSAVMLEAKSMLHCTNLTIQQITEELNFPDQSTFGKYFKRHAGLSPKDYRNSKR